MSSLVLIVVLFVVLIVALSVGLAKTLFNLVLIVFTLVPYLVAKIGLCLTSCCKTSGRRVLAKLFNPFLTLMWRLMFSLCFWIRFDCDGLDEFRKSMQGTKPRILIQNHISFLDAMIGASCGPISTAWNQKSLGSDHLFKMPALGTIMQAWGHLCVPFKTQKTKQADSGNSGGDPSKRPGSVADFSVDKDKVARVMKEFEDHVASGGIGSWFPEGRMNPDPIPSKLQTFRAGGFSIATNVDCEVWCMVTFGNEVCWPRKASLGGNPCRIGVKYFKLCDSTFEYFKKANIDESDDKKHQRLYIANEAQRLMQAEYDLMAEASRGSSHRASKAE